jgi:SNF2 family DNA or RNA helicase
MLLIRKKGGNHDNDAKRPNSLLNRPANANKRIVHRRPATPIKAGFQRPMIKRRAYGKAADLALKTSSLGAKRRFDGMQKLLARAGRGLFFKLPETGVTLPSGASSDTENESDNEEEEEEQAFEPLELWKSPHLGGILKGLPPKPKTVLRPDEYGIEEEVTVLSPVEIDAYAKTSVFVPPVLCKKLRPHQREGVQFMYECVMGLRDFAGHGCILADDMGLGKTLQSLTVIYTLLKTGITADGAPTCKRVIVVCPCSLVKNWESEFQKWLGINTCKVLALAEADRKTMEKNIDCFCRTKMFQVLIVSYEGIRGHIKRFIKHADCCDLLVCDEAHRLKNSENQTSRALNSLPVKRRILLTGTPMQNDLQEFYAMVDFTNPGILGTLEEFRRRILFPVLRGREPDATKAQKEKMIQVQSDMSAKCSTFILRRFNTLNAQHLPPKLVQVVCCNLTDIQKNMYEHLVNSKATKHMLEGKQENCLGSIQLLMKLANHPSLVVDDDADWKQKHASANAKNANPRRGTAQKQIQYCDSIDEKETATVPGADGIAKFLPCVPRGPNAPVHPEWYVRA